MALEEDGQERASCHQEEDPKQPSTQAQPKTANVPSKHLVACHKSQLSSFVLFASLIVLINLCPFQADFGQQEQKAALSSDDQRHSANNDLPTLYPQAQAQLGATGRATENSGAQLNSNSDSDESKSNNNNKHQQRPSKHTPIQSQLVTYLQTSLAFVKLVFSQPLRLNKRSTRVFQAEARVLGKMAKVWYIKKKIKKLGKKLKKHTIAVPVFTAIPIYEHSYYPQPHVTHVNHGAMHHHAASASSYTPTVATQHQQLAPASSSAANSASMSQQQMAASASNQHAALAALRHAAPSHRAGGVYATPHYATAASSPHHIINNYAPSAPLFVDDTGGLYGQYGNAYGRYDGGYHMW